MGFWLSARINIDKEEMSRDLALKANTAVTMGESYEDFMAQSDATRRSVTGQGSELGNGLPRLKINYDAEFVDDKVKDFKPIPLVRGAWSIQVKQEDGTVRTAYGDKAVFRPYVRAYRYSAYDLEKNSSLISTSMFKNWGDMVIDDRGNEVKAGQYKKSTIKNFPDLEEGLQCLQYIFGTVTIVDAKDMYGKEVGVVNVPCMWITKGVAFMPVADAISELSKRGVNMYNANWTITTERKKNGNVTFFVPIVGLTKDDANFTKDDWGLLRDFQLTIQAENEQILTKFKKETTKQKTDGIATQFLGKSADLAADFNDEIPN